jgi:hypothetical protein
MARCRVCGRDFDPVRFQVVAPGLGEGFDRVECAERAPSLLGPPAAPVPLAAVERPVALAPPAAAAPAPLVATVAHGQRPLLLGANLALLAAGTAATVFLWFRVFGADPTPLDLNEAGPAASAFEQMTVPAQITARRASPRRTAPATSAVSSGPPPQAVPTAPATDGAGTLVAAPVPTPPSRTPSGGNGNALDGNTGTPPRALAEPRLPSEPTHERGKSEDAPHGKAHGHHEDHHEQESGGKQHGEYGDHGNHGEGRGKHAGKSNGKHD